MSAINLSAAVASLKPGLSTSPEIALNSWTVLKEVSDTLYPVIETNYGLAAMTTTLLATALIATLIRARLPTIQTQQNTPAERSLVVDAINAATSALPIVACTFYSFSLQIAFHLNCRYFSERLTGAIAYLQPGTETSYDTALVNWAVARDFAEKTPQNIARLQSNCMWVGIAVAIAAIATIRVIRAEQPEQYSKAKRVLDLTTIFCLGLATGISLSAYAYAKNYYPKIV